MKLVIFRKKSSKTVISPEWEIPSQSLWFHGGLSARASSLPCGDFNRPELTSIQGEEHEKGISYFFSGPISMHIFLILIFGLGNCFIPSSYMYSVGCLRFLEVYMYIRSGFIHKILMFTLILIDFVSIDKDSSFSSRTVAFAAVRFEAINLFGFFTKGGFPLFGCSLLPPFFVWIFVGC